MTNHRKDEHVKRQKVLLNALMSTPSEYLTEEWQGKPFIVKRMIPGIQNPSQNDMGKSKLIQRMFNKTIISAGIVLPQTEDIVRLFNISKHRIYDNEGPEAFIYEPGKDGKWLEVRHDNQIFLDRDCSFTNVQAYKDGTYSIDTDNARVQMCWNGVTVSHLFKRAIWEKEFRRTQTVTDNICGIEKSTSLRNPRDGTKLLTVEYDKSTALPVHLTYWNGIGDDWITEDGGATWTVTRDDKKRVLTNPYLTVDGNGNISYLVRERRSREDEGLLVCYIETPCGKRIRTPKRLDTEALMRGGK